ncbi:exodeoxyribonuclease V subunit beta [Thorsellia anophelis]|uniref:RecBCD enzyme subunit RecB n=1 Tax=Thorsellia anophelis DSM 18579 TaxID=1123402 RepID=A0A1I0CHM9_9GAMM|nr:exodeoxyribonuclease V subunit beta [Thorsellia anophelis]SET19029.1 DNA helicase/exodeoxyribonuclease V, beta subunit [Thorsellia anophelis DSM 18579]
MTKSSGLDEKQITMLTLEPFKMPLDGTILIEASAGTGKTYTISLLYLRLLLGIRNENVFSEPLTVEQILVVTFTKAATEELRERIRLNIHELRVTCIRFLANPELVKFSRLFPLIELLDQHKLINTAIERLLLAEQEMDKAAIYTIHGFCQRALSGLAIESGSPFDFELKENNYHMLEQASVDFWRKYCYQMPLYLHKKILSFYATPHDLKNAIIQYLEGDLPVFSDDLISNRTNIIKLSELDKLTTVEQKISYLIALCEQMQIKIAKFKTDWLAAMNDSNSALTRLLSDLSCLHQGVYKPTKIEPIVNKITQWATSTLPDLTFLDEVSLFSQSYLKAKTTKGNKTPSMDLFEEVDKLQEEVDFQIIKSNFLKIAIFEMRTLLQQDKNKKGVLTFNDLISRLDDAFKTDENHHLVKTLQHEFPVALIDEFQDTDPAQYRIFSTLYRTNYHSLHESLLLLIGDPKQAIYGFRGADIHTYMRAKSEAKRHYTLDTNYRSSVSVISSINQLFDYSENPFMYEQIPFYRVNAAKVNEGLGFIVEGKQEAGLNIMRPELDGTLSLVEYKHFMAQALAKKVANWLMLAQNNLAYFQTKSEKKTLQVEDITVIVRSKSEAALIQDALKLYDINSVYLSANESVFSTDLALDLLRLLKAAYEPQNERLIRESLGTILFQMTALELYELQENEQLWENKLYQFQVYQQKWQQYGVMAFLRDVLIENRLSEKWYSSGQGERMLMDFMHLSELLQKAESEFESQHELIKWFGEQIEMPTVESQEAQLRLESDKHVIKIVSIHKSKGLEYPIVLHPFALMYQAPKAQLDFMDETINERVLDIAGIRKDDIKLQAEKSRLSEDIRLSYVALTRAVYHCVIGFSPVREKSNSKSTITHRTSVGSLLVKEDELANDIDFYNVISNIANQTKDGLNSISVEKLTDTDDTYDNSLIKTNNNEQLKSFEAEKFTRTVLDNWTMSSYSHLSTRQKQLLSTPQVAKRDDKIQELLQTKMLKTNIQNVDGDAIKDIYHFPKGAFAGIFLHGILEHPEQYLSADKIQKEYAWRTALERFSIHLNINPLSDDNNELGQWQQVLEDWLYRLYYHELPFANVRLSNIPYEMQSRELHFHLNMPNPLTANQLNKTIQEYDSLSAQADLLTFDTVQGMLQGFIDLVFMHDDKYYIIDYKSNHLGYAFDAYTQANMQLAMIEHRYDLQYQIYTLALHRYLKQRLPNYAYDTHMGGVFYLFIRAAGDVPEEGADTQYLNDLQPGVFYTKPDYKLILELDELF